MGYTSSDDPTFQATVARWVAERHEVLVMIRHSHAAGAKDFEFFESAELFRDRLRGLAPRTCIIVFGAQQLPLRGRADDELIRRSLALIADGTEYLVVECEPVTYGHVSWYRNACGETHEELIDELRDRYGRLIAVGPFPPWLEDGVEVISAVIPNPDGSVTTGVY